MNFLEYIDFLRENELEATFSLWRHINNSMHAPEIGFDFTTPRVKLKEHKIYEYLDTGSYTSFNEEYTFDEDGCLVEKTESYLDYGIELAGASWPDLSTAFDLLPKALLKKYTGLDSFNSLEDVPAEILKKSSIVYYYDGEASVDVHIGDQSIEDESYVNKLSEYMADAISGIAGKGFSGVEVCFVGSDDLEYQRGDYSVSEGEGEEEVDPENCTLNALGLVFELIEEEV